MNEEKELIENCKKDLSYFTRIYDLYVRDVYRYCYSMTSNKEAAEDAVSYSFLRAIENIKTFEFKDKSIKCWLFIIARNYIYKSRRIPNLSDIDENEPEEDDGILEKMIEEENEEFVRKAMDNLKEDEKEIIRLKLWEELQFNEICEVLSIGISSAKMKYYRALEKLKVELEVTI